jgi:cytochrome c biogenesis protein CcmG, thiol:disulfide interchange protein DsbE
MRMTKRLLIPGILLALLFALPLAAEQLKLPYLKVGTVTYTNVTILGANTTDLYFSHSLGFANVKLKYVKPDLQKRFDYNAKVAEEAERKQNEQDLLYESNLARRSQKQAGAGAATSKTTPVIGAETGLADPVSERSLLGKTGPKLEIDKWVTEKPETEGKFVLMSFWTSWSVPCKQWIPELNALQKKFADKLVVVGISTESEATLTDLTEPRIEYASGIDSKAKVGAAAGISSVPCVLLCDPKGMVLYQGHPAALTEKKLQAILARTAE